MYLWLKTRHLAEFNWKFNCTKSTTYKQSCPIYSFLVIFYRSLGHKIHQEEQQHKQKKTNCNPKPFPALPKKTLIPCINV